jgi:hypothetical protein
MDRAREFGVACFSMVTVWAQYWKGRVVDPAMGSEVTALYVCPWTKVRRSILSESQILRVLTQVHPTNKLPDLQDVRQISFVIVTCTSNTDSSYQDH